VELGAEGRWLLLGCERERVDTILPTQAARNEVSYTHCLCSLSFSNMLAIAGDVVMESLIYCSKRECPPGDSREPASIVSFLLYVAGNHILQPGRIWRSPRDARHRRQGGHRALRLMYSYLSCYLRVVCFPSGFTHTCKYSPSYDIMHWFYCTVLLKKLYWMLLLRSLGV
jgi:hypothetical protein